MTGTGDLAHLSPRQDEMTHLWEAKASRRNHTELSRLQRIIVMVLIVIEINMFFFIFITTPEGHVRVHFANLNLISVRHRKYRLIILLYLHLLSCSSTLDLLFFSGSGASTLARELEPPRP